MATVPERCEREIQELHAFFAAWFRGELAEGSFRRIEEALAPGFALVTPRGDLVEREALLAQLRAARGSRPGAFGIWTERFTCRMVLGELCLVTYQEWQETGTGTSGRLSSALFQEVQGAPGGVQWLHVHETWLTPAGTVEPTDGA